MYHFAQCHSSNLFGNWTVMPPCTMGETQHARAKSTKKLGLIPSGPRPTPCKLVLETPSNFSPPRERYNKYSTNVWGQGWKQKKTNELRFAPWARKRKKTYNARGPPRREGRSKYSQQFGGRGWRQRENNEISPGAKMQKRAFSVSAQTKTRPPKGKQQFAR